jgi:hypothetical protein
MSDQPLQRRPGGGREPPQDVHDAATRASESTATDDYLSDVNLGLGNYEDKAYWQQVDSYLKGIYGDAAFRQRLIERAVAETQWELGEQCYDELPSDAKADIVSRRTWIENRGRAAFEALEVEEQLSRLEDCSGLTEAWTPPHWRMMEMRHEASRSRGARLIDNIFGRVTEIEGGSAADQQGALRRALTGGERGGGR